MTLVGEETKLIVHPDCGYNDASYVFHFLLSKLILVDNSQNLSVEHLINIFHFKSFEAADLYDGMCLQRE